jgi:hypothetical protein
LSATAILEKGKTSTSQDTYRFIAELQRLVQYWEDGLLSEDELRAAEKRLLRRKPVWGRSKPGEF